MLANLIGYKSAVTLIKNSGIQFLDFGLRPDVTRSAHGNFARQSANGPLLRLDYDAQIGKFTLPGEEHGTSEIVRPEKRWTLDTSLNVLDGVWLPLPFLRVSGRRTFIGGPDNWARMQIRQLDAPDATGNTLRVCIAFDTRIVPENSEDSTLAPSTADVRNGSRFALAWRNHEISEFLDQTWVNGWLRESFMQYLNQQEDLSEHDITSAMKMFEYQGHYLNLLEMLAEQIQIPEIQITSETLHVPAIPVDLVLDVGNTHTCGVLIEDHGDQNNGLRQCAELEIRSLSQPQTFSDSLFSSYMEFSEARFGKSHFSMESGRDNAFIWPSIVRIGEEALALATRRQGTEGASGISSPRRYLWDETPTHQAWRFSQMTGKTPREPHAAALPLMNLINDDGEPLYPLPMDERLPVFTPTYSRSSLMTMMLCELLAQALSQINSVSHRHKLGHPDAPRRLRHLILTLPSAMPKQEREIFRQRTEEAIALVWKAMNWHPQDEDFSTQRREERTTVPVATVHMEWDEATCGQLVWLYNEAMINYSGHSRVFFRSLARPERQLAEDETPGTTLRVASIDIGGGTTDMAVTQYQLDDGLGSNVKIVPRLLFREGFKIAGDDILLDVIQLSVLPAIQKTLHDAGIVNADGLMAQLFGETGQTDSHRMLRQQTTLQMLIPLGHAILSFWEQSAQSGKNAVFEGVIRDLLPQQPTANVLQYLNKTLQPLLSPAHNELDLLNTTLRVEVAELEEALLNGRFSIAAPLKSLCEVISHYCCDVLLVTGRPSCLPGIQILLRALQPVPVNRIHWLENYPIQERFPFGRHGRIGNPKSTAALGAMLCSLAMDLRLSGFNFKAADIQAYSTIRHLGILDGSHLLSEENIWYEDIDLDNPKARLDKRLHFPLRGNVCLGFRQLSDTRWPASPLYLLKINSSALAKHIAGDGVISVRLRYDHAKSGFVLAEALMQDGTPVSPDMLSLKLNTLANSYRGENHYWIDSGSVYSK
ncbi:virulence factor SrfB [Citrobacter amalonaticus]|uniref:Virulence factor SrfB n=1 Tax=Citrobacter amalonaticus TaxID=35703 RepID=A0A2S4RRE8_CITAM|nr:virulence factor SrfB [Citrobacter amalonaticus]POT54738.1 virulence factor SrfB [Citrobacter amalonaticus]POT69946.1 virulence factor SrfB [Citrobacter amalonaticus]POU61205.1 virulence factor SrfB [Citrobacter amalonaticus]POV02559.1 virulence factor SrfB [Citrobacter amalonaticus]